MNKIRLLVCFKVVPDLEMLADEDWQVFDNTIDTSFVKREINCFDESALEIALKLSDQAGDADPNIHLTGLSIGGEHIDPFLKKLLALRYDQVVRIDYEEDLRFAPDIVASMINAYVDREPQDVLLLGRQSSVGDNAQTPLILAEMLGWPCISQVTAVELETDSLLRVKNQVDDGVVEQVIQPPCVLSIGNAQSTTMRVPTLKDKMKYGKRPLTVMTFEELGLAQHPEQDKRNMALMNLENVDHQREAVKITEGTPEEKALKLFDLYLKERLFGR